MAEQNLQQVTQALQEQNEISEDQSARSAAVIESIGERVEDAFANAPMVEQRESRSAAVIGKLSEDIQSKAKESVEGIKKSAIDTVKNAPDLVMAQLDPVTATVLSQVGGATKSAFQYVQSFGSVIKGKDEEQKEEQNETQEQIEMTGSETVSSIEKLDNSIIDGFERLLAFMKGDSLDDLERRREAAREQTQIPALTSQDEEEEDENLLSKLANMSEILDTVGPILLNALTPLAVGIGVVVGIVKGYATELRLIGRAISGVAKLFSRVFSARAISGSFTGIVSLFQNTVSRIRSGFTVLSETVGRIIKPISEAVNRAKAAGGFVTRVVGGFARLGSIVGSVAGVVSKLFVPLRAIMIGFETIKGAIQGFKEGGLLGGLQGAVTGFAKALIGVPLDLIKKMTSFVLDKLGFDKAASFLESFSFSDIIEDIVSLPYDLLKSAKDWIVNKLTGFSIGDFIGNIAETGGNFIRDLLRGILPDPSVDRGYIKNLAVKAIPNDLYEFAGINPETGEIVPGSESDEQLAGLDRGSSPEQIRSGDQLQMETAARREVELSGGANRRSNRDTGNVNVSSNVVNNSNTTLQNRPGAASTPDNMSDTMMTSGFAP